MAIPQVTLLTECVSEIIEYQTGLKEVIKSVLKHPAAEVDAQYKAETGGGFHAALTKVIHAQEDARLQLERFGYILTYLADEARQGTKGEWREIATAQKHLRVSIEAIRSLRETFGTSLREAKFVVDAYMDGLFE
jgi:ribosomal protein L7/L12